jgi:Dinucleotide-utilizing enzymes involved in molybdopterin and thiamine biosynthesis family 2
MLVMMGVGKVTIVDDDRVEISNLNRQLLYDEEDLGMEKVNVPKKTPGSYKFRCGDNCC